MKCKILGLLVAGMMMAAGSAQAAIFSVTGGGASTLPSGFDLTIPGLSAGDSITIFDSGDPGGFGLVLSEPDTLTFEFLGSESQFTNTFAAGGGDLFSTDSTPVGTTAQVAFGGGLDFLVDFVLSSSGGGSAANGGPISPGLSFAFANITDTSVILLFDDGGFGTDFDDMAIKVSVSQVPLPPAVWLLISAILGLVSFSRIRRKTSQAA